MIYEVICPDGEKRHYAPFDSKASAGLWISNWDTCRGLEAKHVVQELPNGHIMPPRTAVEFDNDPLTADQSAHDPMWRDE